MDIGGNAEPRKISRILSLCMWLLVWLFDGRSRMIFFSLSNAPNKWYKSNLIPTPLANSMKVFHAKLCYDSLLVCCHGFAEADGNAHVALQQVYKFCPQMDWNGNKHIIGWGYSAASLIPLYKLNQSQTIHRWFFPRFLGDRK